MYSEPHLIAHVVYCISVDDFNLHFQVKSMFVVYDAPHITSIKYLIIVCIDYPFWGSKVSQITHKLYISTLNPIYTTCIMYNRAWNRESDIRVSNSEFYE